MRPEAPDRRIDSLSDGTLSEQVTSDPAGALTIVLADDHAVVRSGLRLVLECETAWHVVGEAGNVADARRLVHTHRPDILVLDLNMPGGLSLPAIPQIHEASPSTQVVVLTMQDAPAFARQALRSGAAAYVLKEAADAELVLAIRAVAAGGTYLNPALGARMAAEPAPSGRPDDLSEREVEILRLIALGHTNTEIAGRLFLSVRTVESHRARIQHKTRQSTRAELVHYALEHGLVEL
jgi:two-component system, NarL family, response regulator NreC